MEKTVVIGCGLIGNKRANNLNKKCNIIAVCDSNKNRANIVLKKNRNIKFYSKLKTSFIFAIFSNSLS